MFFGSEIGPRAAVAMQLSFGVRDR